MRVGHPAGDSHSSDGAHHWGAFVPSWLRAFFIPRRSSPNVWACASGFHFTSTRLADIVPALLQAESGTAVRHLPAAYLCCKLPTMSARSSVG